jgi:lipopolysaccharide export system protein LptA
MIYADLPPESSVTPVMVEEVQFTVQTEVQPSYLAPPNPSLKGTSKANPNSHLQARSGVYSAASSGINADINPTANPEAYSQASPDINPEAGSDPYLEINPGLPSTADSPVSTPTSDPTSDIPTSDPASDIPTGDIPADTIPASDIPADAIPADTIPADTIPTNQLQLTADYQDYDPIRQVVTARGNVLLQLNGAFLQADKLLINLLNRYAYAQGNVVLTRGEQIIRGQEAEYNFMQQSGVLFDAKGELFATTLSDDFSFRLNQPLTSQSIYDPLNPDRPISNVDSAGGIQFNTRPGNQFPNARGGIRRLRFEADRVTFDAQTWLGENVRITNDPFSPPEIEFRSDSVTLFALNAEQDLLTARRGRIVFDQGFALPLVREQILLNRGQLNPEDLNPLPTNIGIDGRDRDGLYLERRFSLMQTPTVRWGITPQYLVSRGFSNGFVDPSAFGVETDLRAQLSPRTTLRAEAEISSLELDNVSENLRASARLQQLLGTHQLALEYSYRDRLYNGTLGFQDVRSSLGAVLLSPPIALNNAGLQLNYQLGAQYITADTDRADLLGVAPTDNLVSLGRFQGSAQLSQSFLLWQGKALPPTATEGLRYTPFPLTPQINLSTSLRGVATYYTSGDFQDTLAGDIRLDFQFGHLSRPYFDYTRFNVGYYRALIGGDDSPFLFDRNVDRNVLSFGLTQQVYGPFLLGFQTAINLDTGNDVNTEFILEYSRRSYGIVLRYSPTQQTGAFGFRLSNFNWLGNTDPFDNEGTRQVEGGLVIR